MERTVADDAMIQACLARMLASRGFVQADRSRRFLQYVVTEVLAGRGESLKGYTIGLEVFDREQTFDPAVDAIVRVEAARLRAKLREYYDGEGAAEPVRFELPKGNYAVRVVWQREDVPPARNVVAFPQLIEDRPSLAVLPFVNMSSDPEQNYFADGITDSLITELSRLSGLFVISRQSSFMYRGVDKRAEHIGLELGVRYLLEGSVQRSGAWVRITVQLIDTVSGAHVWAERYDRELQNIFALQDDVTRCIATVLQVRLVDAASGPGPADTVSVEAHDALLRGLEQFWHYTRESIKNAHTHFSQAVKLSPGYAAAHAWLARTFALQWIFLWDPREEVLEKAFEHANMAVDLDPEHPLAYSMLGWVQCWRKQGEASIAAGLRAVALDPNNADAYIFLAITMAVTSRGAEALRYVEIGMRLNPHPSAFNQLALGLCHLVRDEHDAALAAFRRGVEVSDVFIPNHVWLCATCIALGREDEAHLHRDKVLALTGGRIPVLQVIWLDTALRARMNELVQHAGFFLPPELT